MHLVCMLHTYSGIEPLFLLTSKPGSAVGLGGRGMHTEALGGEHIAVLGFLHQEAYLSQQTMHEAWQHGCASNHQEVLRQNLTGVNGALRG